MERYSQVKLLGRGGFARVYLALDNVTKEEYAIKVIDISKMKPENYENEIILFQDISKLSHPNIVKYITSFIDKSKRECNIVMEYCGGNPYSNHHRKRSLSRY